MPTASNNPNHAQPARLLDLLSQAGDDALGSAMLALAHAAAAQHRCEEAHEASHAWKGLTTLTVSHKDKAEHGCSADARRPRVSGPVTTEGDR